MQIRYIGIGIGVVVLLVIASGGAYNAGLNAVPQKEVVREVPKEVVKEVVKEVPKEVIKEVPKEVIKEVVKEVPKEIVKEVEVPKEVVREVIKEVPKEVVREVIKEVPKEVIREVVIVKEIPYRTEVCFPRQTICDSLLISWIDRANKTLHIMIYSFTSDAIGDALVRAKNRGVEVLVVMEEQQVNVQGSEYNKLKTYGINVRIDDNSALMHHKVAIIDGKIVATGSYNWSAAAEDRNDENLILLFNTALAEKYATEFLRVWNKAVP